VPSSCNRLVRRGLTLVEALLIVLIVLVVGAILMPVSVGDRVSARKGACLSDLKQLALAIQMYDGDTNGWLPRALVWADDIKPYTKSSGAWSIYKCPGLQMPANDQFGHAFRRKLGGRREKSFQKPENVPAIFDSTDLSWNANGGLDLLPFDGRHPGGINGVAFLDGHARLLTRLQLFLHGR